MVLLKQCSRSIARPENYRLITTGIGEQKSGIAKFTLDIDRQSTTIRLWMD
jgi:hypothetical protein